MTWNSLLCTEESLLCLFFFLCLFASPLCDASMLDSELPACKLVATPTLRVSCRVRLTTGMWVGPTRLSAYPGLTAPTALEKRPWLDSDYPAGTDLDAVTVIRVSLPAQARTRDSVASDSEPE